MRNHILQMQKFIQTIGEWQHLLDVPVKSQFIYLCLLSIIAKE